MRVERDPDSNDLEVTIDGRTHRVQVEEEERAAASTPPPHAAQRSAPQPAGGRGQIVAPLPGVVLSVAVAPGDAVHTGDTLLILEAMKMENLITADADGVVQTVHVAKGDKVEASQLLVEIA